MWSAARRFWPAAWLTWSSAIHHTASRIVGKTAKKLTIANDDLGDDFEQFLRDACVNMLAVTKGAIYVCMSSSEIHTLQRVFREAGGHWSTFVVWAKNTFTMGRSD